MIAVDSREPLFSQHWIPAESCGGLGVCTGGEGLRSGGKAPQGCQARERDRFGYFWVHGRLPDHVVDLGVHVIGGMDDLGVALIGALREDHLHELFDDIDV